MRADHRCCLSVPLDRQQCKVLDQREAIMSERGPWGDLYDGPAPGRASCAGRSLLELLEDRLDELTWDLMVQQAAGTVDPSLSGEARGVAHAIALIRGPYNPNVDAVKAGAMSRYQDRLSALLAPA